MALQFSDNGLETSTLRELFQELSDGYKGIYGQDIDLDQESPDGQRVAIEAQARADIEAALQWLYSQMDPDFNTGDMQQIIAKLHGLFLRPAPGLSVTLKSQQTGRCFSIAGTRYGTRQIRSGLSDRT